MWHKWEWLDQSPKGTSGEGLQKEEKNEDRKEMIQIVLLHHCKGDQIQKEYSPSSTPNKINSNGHKIMVKARANLTVTPKRGIKYKLMP